MLAKQYLDEQAALASEQHGVKEWEQVLERSTIGRDYWGPLEQQAKAEAARAEQPRHSAKFTKSQPSTKARKAARRRAKAGRKASR